MPTLSETAHVKTGMCALLFAAAAIAAEPAPPPLWRAGLELGGHLYRLGDGSLSGADQRVANGFVAALKVDRAILPWLQAGLAVGLVPSEATTPSSGSVLATYGRLGARMELSGALRPFGEVALGVAHYSAEARSATTWLLTIGAGAIYQGAGWPVAIEAGARWYGHGPDNAVRELPAAKLFVSGEAFVGVLLPFGGGASRRREPGEPEEGAPRAPVAGITSADPAPSAEVAVPLAFLSGGQVELVEPIEFAAGEGTLEGSSHKVLEAVAGLLAENAGTLVIKVSGPRKQKALAAKRSQAIEFFLLGLGVDPTRIKSEVVDGPDGGVKLLLEQ